MKIVLLHSGDAAGPPRDPVLEQVESALERTGHETRTVVVDQPVGALVHALEHPGTPDLVFNLAESFDGKASLEASVTGLLNLLGLRYTGSPPAALTLAGDKSLTKKLLYFHGVRTPEFATVFRGAVDWAGDLDFPLIVKPPQEDASQGITTRSVVHDVGQLLEMIGAVHEEFRQPVLVEEFVVGREFYVGMLGNEQVEALPIIELDFSGFPTDRPRLASHDAKWGRDRGAAEYEGTRAVFPADLDPDLADRIRQVAVASFQALRLRDYGRVDLRVNEAGDVYVLEVNPNCYLERESEFARAAARAGLDHDELMARIVELASSRYAR